MTATRNAPAPALPGTHALSFFIRLPIPLQPRRHWAALLCTLAAGLASAQGTPPEGVSSSLQGSSAAARVPHAENTAADPADPANASETTDSTPLLPTVEVQGQAAAQRRFDAAASFSSVAVDAFTTASPLVNLSELLAAQAGVVVLDRGNFAQDLQISVRGFGSRSTFGVRGVRLLVDGIPATMPDGQGQAATAQLASAARVDVLRGPMAQLYGNAAGGVIQVTTRDPRPGGGAGASVALGSSGQRQLGASFDWGDRTLGGLVDVSHFSTDGWRAHSAARRTHLNSKWVARPGADTKITALINLYDQPRAQDPLGLTRAQWQADPRQSTGQSVAFNTRKSVSQNQLGLVLEQRLGASDDLRLRAYGGTRELVQFLPFSGAAATSAGGVVDLDRRYGGLGAAWTHQQRLASGLPLRWTLGLDIDRLKEQRQGLVNNAGMDTGALRRNERDRAGNTDVFAQVDALLAPTWRVVAGVRSSRVRLAVDDQFIALPGNPDDSGQRTWRHTSPVLGVVWSAADSLNLYANLGRGFETPTLAESAYSAGSTGPNTALQASRSLQAEVGAKWRGNGYQLDTAWFDARSRDEIVPAASLNGRSIYQNADRVRRQGLEMAWSATQGAWRPQFTYTYLDAAFASPYLDAAGQTIAAGNRLPGTARHTARLAFTHQPSAAWQWGADLNLSGKVFANDRNTDAAPGFAVASLHASHALGTSRHGSHGSTRWQVWARVDNLLDRNHVGSLVVNDGNGRFFEPAAGRRFMVGLRAQLD